VALSVAITMMIIIMKNSYNEGDFNDDDSLNEEID